jgi:myo-inositol-1(or 4)-monophosphatase
MSYVTIDVTRTVFMSIILFIFCVVESADNEFQSISLLACRPLPPCKIDLCRTIHGHQQLTLRWSTISIAYHLCSHFHYSMIFLYSFLILFFIVHPLEGFQQQQFRRPRRSTSYRPTGTVGAGRSGADDSTQNPPPDDALLEEILQVAQAASQEASGIIANNARGAAVVQTKSTSRDLLTLIDPLCERAIREMVTARFPHHAFLGEEGVEPGVEAARAALEAKLALGGWLWIVDPIDGTTNFASGIPLNAPSVAVAYNGKIMVGVIHDPHRDEVWTAVRGRGAWLNGKSLRVDQVSGGASIGDAVIGAESPAGQKSLQVALQGIQALMPHCRTLRILGSTAVQLPWVAQGRLTCYWSPDECAWDHAAGAIIVEEAGGIITDLDGTPFTLRTRKFIASQNEEVHQQVLQVLNEAGIS